MACNFIEKETLAQVFSHEFSEISKNTFFTEHLRGTASRETKKQTNLSGNSSSLIDLLFLRLVKVLSSFFGAKSFLFLKSINK